MSSARNPINRRLFLRGALATSLIPIAGAAASCASPGGDSTDTSNTGAKSAENPFGLAANAQIEAVVFNGGYGYDYVTFAGGLAQAKHEGLKVKVLPSTEIAQELQPRFVGGNPPDLINNGGAGNIAMTTVIDQLATLDDVLEATGYDGAKIADSLYPGVKLPGTFNGKFLALNYVMTVFSLWYSASLFEENGWTPPKTWAEAKELGAKAKAKGKYLFVFGKEASNYYQWTAIDSAIKESGHEVRLALENLEPNAWSHPALRGVLTEIYDIVRAGYIVPGGAGTQFTAAQARWSNDQQALMYSSGGWIENEMKKATKQGFRMTGVPVPTLTTSPALPFETIRAAAGEPFIVPNRGKSVAGGKEILRAMLSKEAAANFAKTRLAPTVVKGTVPADGYGSSALVSQATMLEQAGENMFSFVSESYYGLGPDQIVLWNSFLSGGLNVAEMVKGLQAISDKIANNSSVEKIKIS
ncbi:N-acetylglucosamine/diacetylchitobiose ABC transporter substrate-binding protein [Micromonospora sp. WMMD1102]|uniref:N-acetylglucosamine/diacetylchitobiose ABC transporter substrate-binding protein n=1 Tax=Micromonospora sp. WMMD1102 TaxID=3016105 RepID=UPI0024152A1F|nr:N-acetylglucosamine/diacetylchitobiose ABC transporter substrate-binding protein [Micromonospora sp. WMMD1102]MDG4791738.1 N-acetylglucosamine/diacetylchitobiose ABC transporter substrate-binding protein [Micromonospora sp. WMMD1102]